MFQNPPPTIGYEWTIPPQWTWKKEFPPHGGGHSEQYVKGPVSECPPQPHVGGAFWNRLLRDLFQNAPPPAKWTLSKANIASKKRNLERATPIAVQNDIQSFFLPVFGRICLSTPLRIFWGGHSETGCFETCFRMPPMGGGEFWNRSRSNLFQNAPPKDP